MEFELSRRGLNVGPILLTWVGLFLICSVVVGMYYFVRFGRRRGFTETDLYNAGLSAILSGTFGAWAFSVAMDWPQYTGDPLAAFGLRPLWFSFHGALLAAYLAIHVYAGRRGISAGFLLDAAVPGLALGLLLTRIAGVLTGELVGRPAVALPWDRHPVGLYGAMIGGVGFLVHNVSLRRIPDASPGIFFWRFVALYTVLRALLEDPFWQDRLYVLGYLNLKWGLGALTLHQLAAVPILAVTWAALRGRSSISGFFNRRSSSIL